MKNLDELKESLVKEFSELTGQKILLETVLMPGIVDSFMLVEMMNIIDENITDSDYEINFNNAFSDDEVSIHSIVNHIKNRNK